MEPFNIDVRNRADQNASRVFQIALVYVIGPNRRRDFFGFVCIYDGQAIEFGQATQGAKIRL
jgi:hypothetical protein